jgi:hypothetical protein
MKKIFAFIILSPFIIPLAVGFVVVWALFTLLGE